MDLRAALVLSYPLVLCFAADLVEVSSRCGGVCDFYCINVPLVRRTCLGVVRWWTGW